MGRGGPAVFVVFGLLPLVWVVAVAPLPVVAAALQAPARVVVVPCPNGALLRRRGRIGAAIPALPLARQYAT